MISVNIIYTIVFLNFVATSYSIFYLRKIDLDQNVAEIVCSNSFKSILDKLSKVQEEIDITKKDILLDQKIAERTWNNSFKRIFDKLSKVQEETDITKKEILEEIYSMRKEWDMEVLKKNILQQSHGNSRNWEKWQKAFGGKNEKVGKNDD